MSKRRQPAPQQRPAPANTNIPLLTIDRAIADGLSPSSLRQVADSNMAAGGGRRERQARNLYIVAERLELLGYGRGEERRVA